MNSNCAEQHQVFFWNDHFKTHIAMIDQQHQQLMRLLNRLVAQFATLDDGSELKTVVSELVSFADDHFKTEESFWQSYFSEDSWLTSHIKSHRTFSDKISELARATGQKAQYGLINEVVRDLIHWAIVHFLERDKRMAIAVQAREKGYTIEAAKRQADQMVSESLEMLMDSLVGITNCLVTRTIQLMEEKSARKRAEMALRIDEKRWQFVMDDAHQTNWEWDLSSGEIAFSGNYCPVFDLFKQRRDPTHKINRIHPDDVKKLKNDLQNHLDGDTELFVNEHREFDSHGKYHWVVTQGKVIYCDGSNKPARMVGTHVNITKSEIANLLFQHSNEGMMVTDAYNNIIAINPAFTDITGYSCADVIGKQPNILASGYHSKEFYRQMRESLRIRGSWQGELWSRKKDGTIFTEWLIISTVYHPDRTVKYRLGLFSDISEKKANEEAVWKRANFDELTGLPNRQMFNDRLFLDLKTAIRDRLKLALLFIDLDKFKEVNDSFGHAFGDLLLADVAKRLKTGVRESDTVARLSGDEFTVILKSISMPEHADRIARDILYKLQQPFVIGEEVIYVSASIGISVYPDDANDKDKLLRNADQAMYQAKQNGRNRVVFFTRAMQEVAQNRIRIANDLRTALANREFVLVFQPVVELSTGDVHKAEALIRWRHPHRGVLIPGQFISIAEDTGIIHEIGNWVFYESARQVEVWQKRYGFDFQISINKSPVQFYVQYETQHNWLDYLQRKQIPERSIIIEIKESLLQDANESIRLQLERYAHAGLQVALDDFGTGFSSLAYLQKFAIDFIKIDQTFVETLTPNCKSLALCKAMVMMAHELNIKVIAEGIETEQQKELLLAIGCDYGQGYLFSEPVEVEQFEKLLQSGRVID